MKEVLNGLSEKTYAVYDDECQGVFIDHSDCFHLMMLFSSEKEEDVAIAATMVAQWMNKYLYMYTAAEGK